MMEKKHSADVAACVLGKMFYLEGGKRETTSYLLILKILEHQ